MIWIWILLLQFTPTVAILHSNARGFFHDEVVVVVVFANKRAP